MNDVPQDRWLSFDGACLIAIAVTVAFAVAGIIGAGTASPAWPFVALCWVGVSLATLALPFRDSRWRAGRDGMRVGLAWAVVIPLAIGLCIPGPYLVPLGVFLAVGAPLPFVSLLGLLAAHIAVLKRAKVRRATVSFEDSDAWELASVVPAVLLLVLLVAGWLNDPSAIARRPRPERSLAVAAIRAVHSCARRWTAEHGGAPPEDLAALRSTPRPCIDRDLAKGEAGGWTIDYRVDTARPGGFTIVARESGRQFYVSLASDESGLLHYADGGTVATRSGPALASVAEELRLIESCLYPVWNDRPIERPATLAELAPLVARCRPLDSARWTPEGNAVVVMDRMRTYERYRLTVGLVIDSGGRPTLRMDARPEPYPAGGVRSFLLVHGRTHATGDDRPATVADPLISRCEDNWHGDCR